MTNEDNELPGRSGSALERPVVRPVTERAGFLLQIEASRREVASWPEWMRATAVVPAWMANHATDL